MRRGNAGVFVEKTKEEDLMVFCQVLGFGDQRVAECVGVGCPRWCFVGEVRI
jgi:hypothetical protein